MEGDSVKKLRIKSGIVKRLIRDYRSYEAEVQKDRERINQYKESGSSDESLRRQEEVLEETIRMIPDTRRRLVEAYNTLKDLMKDLDSNEELVQSELWTEAAANIGLAEEIIA